MYTPPPYLSWQRHPSAIGECQMLTFFGWISAGLFLLILVKFLTKRLHLKRLNTFFMKYHRRFTYTLIAACAIHILSAFLSFHLFSPLVMASGLLCFFCIIITSRSRKRHDNKNWIYHHRFFAASALLLVICHIILQVKH